jgi:OOP family OmpA-OmpF porin
VKLSSHSLSAALAVLFLALPLQAAPLLDMPAPASQIGGWADSPSTLRVPIGPFAAGALPLREVAGAIDQRAYRMDGQRLTTLQLITPLLAQLAQEGYKTLYQCETSACGGFDFRYGMNVLPEPQMHVDLGDFRYIAAERPSATGPDLVALLVSRSSDTGFVQVTSITGVSSVAATKPATAAAATPAALRPPVEQPAEGQGDLGRGLLADGSVALDDLIFDSGSAALEDKDYASLQALADWLTANPTRNVTLVGHTDASGALVPNVALSRLRAQSVRAALVAKFGADPARIDAQGAGYLAPRASNETAEGRTKNRRVEVMLTPTP